MWGNLGNGNPNSHRNPYSEEEDRRAAAAAAALAYHEEQQVVAAVAQQQQQQQHHHFSNSSSFNNSYNSQMDMLAAAEERRQIELAMAYQERERELSLMSQQSQTANPANAPMSSQKDLELQGQYAGLNVNIDLEHLARQQQALDDARMRQAATLYGAATSSSVNVSVSNEIDNLNSATAAAAAAGLFNPMGVNMNLGALNDMASSGVAALGNTRGASPRNGMETSDGMNALGSRAGSRVGSVDGGVVSNPMEEDEEFSRKDSIKEMMSTIDKHDNELDNHVEEKHGFHETTSADLQIRRMKSESMEEEKSAFESTPSVESMEDVNPTSKELPSEDQDIKVDNVEVTPTRVVTEETDEAVSKVKEESSDDKKPSKRKTPPSTSSKKTPTKKKKPSTPKKKTISPLQTTGCLPGIHDSIAPITESEYANLDALMTQFCKVPLLAEFSRPVSLLHPELVPVYSKVVKHPIDLGTVCRAIRRRRYRDTRQVCIDMWRIFANCVKYHTHPVTREGAIPSFVSIANHLREYFNSLWMEYMIPSEPNNYNGSSRNVTKGVKLAMQTAESTRIAMRKERVNALTAIVLSPKCIRSAANDIDKFIESGGKVDALDTKSIIDYEVDKDVAQAVFNAFSTLSSKLKEISRSQFEFTVESFNMELKRCFSLDIIQDNSALGKRFESRIDRLLGKVIAPVFEVSCRGVNQSSVWGCMAAAIWARDRSKRPYWPSLVLGILAPDDQKEDWHKMLTDRNEARFPEKLRQDLQAGKKKAEQALRRQASGGAERMSFFLVEFLGTHEFIWVREADIIENFDPEEDPNQTGIATKRKKSSLRNQTPQNARMLQSAIEEGKWAMEEFEMQLNDPCGDLSPEDEDEEEEHEENYSYEMLCETDDEADEADGGTKDANDDANDDVTVLGSPTGRLTDLEEINELLSTDGMLDYSSEGRKSAKRRSAALKKQQADAKREANKKETNGASKKKSQAGSKGKNSKNEASKHRRLGDLEERREQKELEKRRKKRERERERIIREGERNAKKMKSEEGNSIIKRGRKLGIADKRGRATKIVRGYLKRMTETENLRGLALGGVMTIPAASVDSSGLLAMTLAFRAAAGEIEMPHTNDNPSTIKPWDKINVDDQLKSKDRCENLKKQIELLEKAVAQLDEDNKRRKVLMGKAIEQQETNTKNIAHAEKEARQNDMPKRKVVKKTPQKKAKEEQDGSGMSKDEGISVENLTSSINNISDNISPIVSSSDLRDSSKFETDIGGKDVGREINEEEPVAAQILESE